VLLRHHNGWPAAELNAIAATFIGGVIASGGIGSVAGEQTIIRVVTIVLRYKRIHPAGCESFRVKGVRRQPVHRFRASGRLIEQGF